MLVWRISKAKYSHSAFSGEGARLFDARWNFAGVPMVYTSKTLSLEAMEFLVHVDPATAPTSLVALTAEIPERLRIETVEVGSLPKKWRMVDNQRLRKIGTDWAKSLSSVALEVPSAVIDGEKNVLLNPMHPDFASIRVQPPKRIEYDERVFRR